MTDCVFCEIIRHEAPAEIVEQWSQAIAIRPLNPVTEGHILVIPNDHVEDFTTDSVVTEITAYYAAELAARLGGEWNLITSKGPSATQTVHHLHVHLVPRRPGDGLALPWTEPKGVPFRTHTELHAAAEAERARDWPAPRIVPHPDGGVTMTSQTQENPAPEREPGGVSDQPTAIAGLGFTEFGERTDRPGIIRRILHATRSTT